MKTFDQIVSEVMGIPREELADSLTPHDVPDWDSMNYLLCIAELEKEYTISFTMDEVMGAISLGDLRAIVERKKV